MKTNKWVLVASMIMTAFAVQAQAQAAKSDISVTGNMGLFSDYRFRGISQTDRKPALQGGFDLTHSSGLYFGNWNSNIDSAFYNGSNLEMDFYGGYKTELGGVGLDFGAIYYYYPGSGKAGTSKIDNTEIYLGASYGPVSLKYFHAVSDFFSVPNTKGTGYLDLGFTQDLGGGFGVNAHAGYQKVRNTPGRAGKITDYKFGVTYDLNGFILGAAYIGTNRDGIFFGPQSGKDLAKGTAVMSVVKSF